MSSLPGTDATSQSIGLGDSYSNVLTTGSDIDWIQLSNGLYSDGSFTNHAYLTVTSDQDLSNAQVSVYVHYDAYGQDYWYQQYYSIEELADGLGRYLSVPEASGNTEAFVSVTGFTGSYTVSLADGELLFDSGDVDIDAGVVYSGTVDYGRDQDYFIYDDAVAGHFYRIVVTPDAALMASDVEIGSSSSYGNTLHRVETESGWHLETTGFWDPFNQFTTSIFTTVTGFAPEDAVQTFTGLGYTVELQDLGTSIGRTNVDVASAQTLSIGTETIDTISALDLEQFYTFDGLAGQAYMVLVDGHYSTDVVTATAMVNGVENVIGSAGFSGWDYGGFNVFSTFTLQEDTQVTFSIENQVYLGEDPSVAITVFELDDAVSSVAEYATELTIGTGVQEGIHFEDVDMWRFEVEEGEFYTVTLDYEAGSDFSAWIRGHSDITTIVWESNTANSRGEYTYVFSALADGTATVSVNNSVNFTRGGVPFNLTPADVNDLSYTITATQGITDDRAAVWSSLAGPININEVTPALANGPMDVDGFVFDVVAGNTYSIAVDDTDAYLYLYTDADGNGLSYWTNDYREDRPLPDSPGFAEQAAALEVPGINLVTEDLGSGTILTFTALYTGQAGVNVYPGADSGLYNVYVSDDGVSEALIDSLGLLDAEGPDLIVGDAGDNLLEGLGGNDTLVGEGGADTLDGGQGIDEASYADAASRVVLNLANGGVGGDAAGDVYFSIENVTGTDFNDYVFGDAGNNLIVGGAGDDTLRGHTGDDTLVGGAGADDLNGGTGTDEISYADAQSRVALNLRTSGTSGDAAGDTFASIENVTASDYRDYVFGNSADNFIDGGEGDDVLRGHTGNDTLLGGDGFDDLDGGFGDDILSGGEGFDLLTGGRGADTLDGEAVSYASATARVNLDLRTGGFAGDAAGDVFFGAENVIGSIYGDYLFGTANENIIVGGDGADLIRGHSGDDVLLGGEDGDDLNGGAGIDTASYAIATARVALDLRSGGTGGEAAGDTFVSIENVEGSDFNDYIFGDGTDNLIDGGSGDDLLRGHTGADTLFGGDGDDDLNGGSGNDFLVGGADDDLLLGGRGADTLLGGDGEDTASYAGASARVNLNLLSGGFGGDAAGDLFFGVEHVIGSDHNDYIFATTGDNIISGGTGADRIRGHNGNDTLIGGAGADDLNGGAGTDLASYETAQSRVALNLNSGGTAGDAAGDTFASIENVTATDYNDYVFGSSADNVIDGGAGNDILRGHTGDDTLNGGTGDDNLNGGAGRDVFVFEVGGDRDTISGFQDNVDAIAFTGFNLATPQDAMAFATQSGLDVVFDFGSNDVLTVLSVGLSDLSNDLTF